MFLSSCIHLWNKLLLIVFLGQYNKYLSAKKRIGETSPKKWDWQWDILNQGMFLFVWCKCIWVTLVQDTVVKEQNKGKMILHVSQCMDLILTIWLIRFTIKHHFLTNWTIFNKIWAKIFSFALKMSIKLVYTYNIFFIQQMKGGGFRSQNNA